MSGLNHDTAPADIDLGHGHELRWAAWAPDRQLNPQYEELPDIEHFVGLIRHPVLAADDQEFCRERGYCEGAVTLDSDTARQITSARALWQVDSLDPLTLSPSVLCHCGDHGWIREGRWIPA